MVIGSIFRIGAFAAIAGGIFYAINLFEAKGSNEIKVAILEQAVAEQQTQIDTQRNVIDYNNDLVDRTNNELIALQEKYADIEFNELKCVTLDTPIKDILSIGEE